MKNWIRIFLVCFVLIGGTAFFVFRSLNQFNNALDNLSALSASNFATAKIPPIPFSDKTNKAKAQIPTSAPETILFSATSTTPETIPVSTTSTESTDLKMPSIFPTKDSEVYIGCTYQTSFQ